MAVVPGHVAEPGGWVRLWLRVEIPLLQPLLLAAMGTDLRAPYRPGRAPRSLGFHWARFNRGRMLHAAVCVYKRAHDLRKSPAFLFWHCSRGPSDFSFRKDFCFKSFFFLRLSSTFSRLKKMLCLTSTAIMLLLLSFNFFFLKASYKQTLGRRSCATRTEAHRLEEFGCVQICT